MYPDERQRGIVDDMYQSEMFVGWLLMVRDHTDSDCSLS